MDLGTDTAPEPGASTATEAATVVQPLTPSLAVLASIALGGVLGLLLAGSAIVAGNGGGAVVVSLVLAVALLIAPTLLSLRILFARVRVDAEWVTYVTWTKSHGVRRSAVAGVSSGSVSTALVAADGSRVLALGCLWERGAPGRLGRTLGVPLAKPGKLPRAKTTPTS